MKKATEMRDSVKKEEKLLEEYFSRVSDRESQFDRDASRILTAFGKSGTQQVQGKSTNVHFQNPKGNNF